MSIGHNSLGLHQKWVFQEITSCAPLIWIRLKTAMMTGDKREDSRARTQGKKEEGEEGKRGRGEKIIGRITSTNLELNSHPSKHTPEEERIGILREELWNIWMLLVHTHLEDGCLWSTKLEEMREDEEEHVRGYTMHVH